MAGSRTLKLSILADVDDLKKNLDKGSNEVEGFGGKLEKFGKVAAAAFAAAAAAAAAYAGKLAIEGVKAAIEDEAAQKRLALALQNVTGATNEQIAAVEAQILKQSLATGVADDQLRPALQRLATSTSDVKQSQELLSLALDIAAAKNISVETAANALAKAYDGNNGALARLGVGLTATEIKTLGFEGTVKALSDTFGGTAATQAETFEGRIARLKVQFDETKESVGAALLPIIEKLLTFITDVAIPKFQEFKTSAIDPVILAFKRNESTITSFINLVKDILVPVLSVTLLNALKGLTTVASVIVSAVSAALRALEPIINSAIAGINAVITAKNLLSPGPDTKTIPKVNFDKSSGAQPNTVSPEKLPFSAGTTPTVSKKLTSGGGNLIAGGSTVTVPTVTTITVPSGSTGIPAGFNPALFRMAEERGNVTVNVNAPSVIDEEGFARAIILALNNSTNRGTTGAGDFRTNAQIL